MGTASVAALAIQTAILAGLAGAGPRWEAVVLVLGVAIASAAVPPLFRRWPETTAMLAIGGLGMVVGWWADLGFQAATDAAPHPVAALDTIWCRSSLGGAAGSVHLLSWMNAGMLALGVPASEAARMLRGRRHDASAIVTCALAMIAGMAVGSVVGAPIARVLGPEGEVIGDWVGMMLGMLAGMTAVRPALTLLLA